MQVQMTQRATIALQAADGELQRRLKAIVRSLESGDDLPRDQVRQSHSRPNVYVARVMDHRLFYRLDGNVILVLDIVPREEAYR